MKKEPNITERQAREIVEKMGRREPYTSKSIDDFYRSIGLEPEEPEQPGKTVTEEAEIPMADEPSGVATGEAAMPQKRISGKQRRLSLDEYRTTYLKVPKIINRKPVFVSETVRAGQGCPLPRREGHERIRTYREPCPPAPRCLPE